MSHAHLFTIFTPTFNRAHLLPRLYASLQAQTFRDFEWVIVDDGSTDGTRELVTDWQANAPFPIRYFWQANAGKHVAYNRGVREARGELVLDIDSDDEILPHGIERMATHWADIQALPEAEAARFTGVTSLCQDQHGRLIGTRFPRDVTDSDSNEIKYRYRSSGDKWGFHRTAVLQEFPFPEIAGVRFVPESIVWNAIARTYKTRFVNEMLQVVWSHDGPRLTTGGVSFASAAGSALWHREILNTNLRFLRYAPDEFAKSAVHYARFSFHAGDGIATQARGLRGFAARSLWLAAAPVGWLVYRRDVRRGSSQSPKTNPAVMAVR